MEIREEVASKLDHELLLLLREGRYSPSAEIPIVLFPRQISLDDLVELIGAAKGRVRHVLAGAGAVSAWLSLEAVAELAQDSRIAELELPETDRVAAG